MSVQTTSSPIQSAPSLGGVYALLIVLALLLSAIAFHVPASPPHYKYMIKSIPDGDFESQMNDLGQQGWDAVSARRASDGTDSSTFSYEIIFKRESNP
ncbi:MAG: hypothetical protein ACRYFS_06095 [Janthinobacterium lividum]